MTEELTRLLSNCFDSVSESASFCTNGGLELLFVKPEQTILEAIKRIESNSLGIALVVDDILRLKSVITDGDIRRVILKGIDVKTTLLSAITENRNPPFTAPIGTPHQVLLKYMTDKKIRHIPLVDGNEIVRDLCILSDLLNIPNLEVEAVILAGGFGKRLLPLTANTPKPMLKIGEQPLLERIVRQIRQAGISRINISTHHQAEEITNYFGDGSKIGIQINYIHEKVPLGTAGVLSLLHDVEVPILVMNGDIITQLDFRALMHFHLSKKADLTIAAKQLDFKIAYGVLETAEDRVTRLEEKPTHHFMINAGIYVLNPSIKNMVTQNVRTEMTDLISEMLAKNMKVVYFPIQEYWLDIGTPADYQQAITDLAD